MRAFAGYLALWVTIGTPVRALAQADMLEVARAEGAEDCPDSAALLAKVQSIRGSSAAGWRPYTVRFSRTASLYAAAIQVAGAAGQERKLTSTEADCGALAQATAVTLALLFDAAAPPPAAPPSAIAAPAPTRSPPAEPTPASSRPWQLSLSLGAALLLGVVRPVAPLLDAEAGLTTPRWRFGLGALWVPRQTLDLPPGSVTETLWSAAARSCYAPLLFGAVRLEICAGVWAGAVHAAAHDFTSNEAHTRPFVALPAALSAAWLGDYVGVELNAGLLVPLTRNEFTIDGLHEAYQPAPLSAAIGLRVLGLMPW
jgi:hypothetical protein